MYRVATVQYTKRRPELPILDHSGPFRLAMVAAISLEHLFRLWMLTPSGCRRRRRRSCISVTKRTRKTRDVRTIIQQNFLTQFDHNHTFFYL